MSWTTARKKRQRKLARREKNKHYNLMALSDIENLTFPCVVTFQFYRRNKTSLRFSHHAKVTEVNGCGCPVLKAPDTNGIAGTAPADLSTDKLIPAWTSEELNKAVDAFLDSTPKRFGMTLSGSIFTFVETDTPKFDPLEGFSWTYKFYTAAETKRQGEPVRYKPTEEEMLVTIQELRQPPEERGVKMTWAFEHHDDVPNNNGRLYPAEVLKETMIAITGDPKVMETSAEDLAILKGLRTPLNIEDIPKKD